MPTLTWAKDDDARKQAQTVPYRLSEYVPELSAGDLTTELQV